MRGTVALMPAIGPDSEVFPNRDPRGLKYSALRVFLDAKGDQRTDEY
jgi:hypothetical protein